MLWLASKQLRSPLRRSWRRKLQEPGRSDHLLSPCCYHNPDALSHLEDVWMDYFLLVSTNTSLWGANISFTEEKPLFVEVCVDGDKKTCKGCSESKRWEHFTAGAFVSAMAKNTISANSKLKGQTQSVCKHANMCQVRTPCPVCFIRLQLKIVMLCVWVRILLLSNRISSDLKYICLDGKYVVFGDQRNHFNSMFFKSPEIALNLFNLPTDGQSFGNTLTLCNYTRFFRKHDVEAEVVWGVSLN